MHILKEFCDMTTSFPAIYFRYDVSLFHGNTWSNPYVQDAVFISKHLLRPSTITSGLCLIQENLKGMFIWEKPL